MGMVKLDLKSSIVAFLIFDNKFDFASNLFMRKRVQSFDQ